VNIPPDDTGEERSPIASTVPSPIETHAAEPAVATHTPSTDVARDARHKRLLSKAAYRERCSLDRVFREAERERVREWRRKRPDKVKAQKKKARAENYHRPIVAIDAEGQNYPGADVLYGGVRHPRHETYLWVRRPMMAGRLRGLWGQRPAALISALSTQIKS
jgi:hypothetical protein